MRADLHAHDSREGVHKEGRCKMTEKNQERLVHGGFYIAVFSFLLIFFVQKYPLIIDNLDDWTYCTFLRPAIPMWNAWNPSRVLPEILMPACAQIAVWLMLLTGDYIGTIAWVNGVFLSLMITVYIALFMRLYSKRMNLHVSLPVFFAVLFFAMHFKKWSGPQGWNEYLFYTGAPTRCYFYLIPVLLNAQLVMLLETWENEDKGIHAEYRVRNGILIVLIYFAMFSNLFGSCILAVYAGYGLLCSGMQAVRRHLGLKEVVKSNCLYIGVILTWMVSAIFEIFGGRADSLKTDVPLYIRVKDTVQILLEKANEVDPAAFFLCFAILAAGLATQILTKEKQSEDKRYLESVIKHAVCGILVQTYLVLLCAVTYPYYVALMDVVIGVAFYVLLAVFDSLAYLIKKRKSMMLALPIIAVVMVFGVFMDIDCFAQNNELGVSARVCYETNQSFLRQILEADRAGMREMTLKVPQCDREDNWPYALVMGDRMAKTLRSHGMIECVEHITVEPVNEFYEIYGIEQ